jgi:nitrous oxidase accessory protein NosD
MHITFAIKLTYHAAQFSANESYYLAFGHNHSVSTFYGNFWSDNNGTDPKGDGIGETITLLMLMTKITIYIFPSAATKMASTMVSKIAPIMSAIQGYISAQKSVCKDFLTQKTCV